MIGLVLAGWPGRNGKFHAQTGPALMTMWGNHSTFTTVLKVALIINLSQWPASGQLEF